MKKQRQAKTLEIISNYEVETQEELQTYLKNSGLEVTQATISRDIRELRLIKARTVDGKSVYSAGKKETDDISARMKGIFSESIVKVECALNTVCIKCFPGMANAACATIDAMHFEGLVGTIAGDDTIFALCRTEKEARLFADNLETMIHA